MNTATSKRRRKLPALACAAMLLAACGGGGKNDGQPVASFVRISPDPAVVARGSSTVIRVDVVGADNQAPTGYATDFDETLSRVRITTAPCPAALQRPACQEWTLAPAADSLPGRYPIGVQTVGLPTGVASTSFELHVLDAPAPRHGAAIAASDGGLHALVLTADGRLFASGATQQGRMGVGRTWESFVAEGRVDDVVVFPTQIEPFVRVEVNETPEPRFVSLAATTNASYAVGDDGRVWHWGTLASGLGGTPQQNPPARLRAAPIEGLSDIIAVAADSFGSNRAFALARDGRVYTWGAGNPLPQPARDGSGGTLRGVRAIVVSRSAQLFLTSDGDVLQGWWPAPRPVTGLPPIVQITADGASGSLPDVYAALDADGGIWTWSAVGRAAPSAPERSRAVDDATAVAVLTGLSDGAHYFALRRNSGSLWTWNDEDVVPTEIPAPAGRRFVHIAPPYAITDDCSAGSGSLWRLTRIVGTARVAVAPVQGFGIGELPCSAVPAQTATLTTAVEGRGRILSEPAGIDCGDRCGTTFKAGAPLRLEVMPEPGWVFDGWRGPAPCLLATDLLAVGEHRHCTAAFREAAPSEFRLTVINRTGGGSVMSAPAGIDCGAACTRWFAAGSELQLSVVPDPGYRIGAWTAAGDLGGEDDCRDGHLTLDGPRICEVKFVRLPSQVFSISFAVQGNGTVRADAGLLCRPGDPALACLRVFESATVITASAEPAQGQVFLGWSSDDAASPCSALGPSTPVQITVDRDLRCVARFGAPDDPTLSVRIINGSVADIVQSQPPGISCSAGSGSDCVETYPAGAVVMLNAARANFRSWQGCDAVIDVTSCRVAMDASREVTATFGP